MGSHTDNHSEHHIIPFNVLTKVMIALLIATWLTVFFAKFVHLGVLAAPVALIIAITKAMLVMAYFMGLKYDNKLNQLIFATGFFFLLVLIFFCVLDIWTRVPQSNTL